MKTVIKINGLDVEFTDQKPTRPGAYWWVWNASDKPQLRTIFNPCSDVLIDLKTDLQPKDVGGLWSAPLVPVTEVERAYFEGHEDANYNSDQSTETKQWAADAGYQLSNARRVVEGLE